MDNSEATEEPFPSHASPHPISEQLRLHQQKQPKSVPPTTRMKQTQEGEGLAEHKSSMCWNFSKVTPTRRTRSVMLPPLIRKSEQGFHLEICGGGI
uniref:Uncharacterized protein n=1 Tax=Oryza barthii TaxID=65489 RepID=A0A0D3HM07_9ORYZ